MIGDVMIHSCYFRMETTNKCDSKILLPTLSFFFCVEPCTSCHLTKSLTSKGLYHSALNSGFDVSFFKVKLWIWFLYLQRWTLDLTSHSSTFNYGFDVWIFNVGLWIWRLILQRWIFYAIPRSSKLQPEPTLSSSIIILPSTPRSSKWSPPFRLLKLH